MLLHRLNHMTYSTGKLTASEYPNPAHADTPAEGFPVRRRFRRRLTAREVVSHERCIYEWKTDNVNKETAASTGADTERPTPVSLGPRDRIFHATGPYPS